MSDENQIQSGVNNGEGAPGVSQAPEQTGQDLSHGNGQEGSRPDGGNYGGEGAAVNAPDKQDDSKRIVDAERLNALLADSKRLKELEEKGNQTSEEINRIKEGLRSLTGESPKDQADGVSELSSKYKVPEDFLRELLDVTTKTVEQKTEERLKPLRKQQAEQAFQREVSEFYQTVPEAKDMSPDERKEFFELVAKPEYGKLPLQDIYKLFTYDRPAPTGYSAEGARNGSRGFGDTRGIDMSKISSMSPEEFKEFSDNMPKHFS